MNRVRKILGPLVHAAAWLVLSAAITCFALERSDWIGDSVRARATDALEGLEFDFARTRILWLRPGVILEDVSIEAKRGFLAFDSIEVRLDPFGGSRGLVREVELRGGRARISEDLETGLRRVFEAHAQEGQGGEAPFPIPTLTVTDFAVDFELPNGRTVPLGRIDLRVQGTEGDAHVSGRLLQLLGTSGKSAVHLAGTVGRSGRIEVQASASGLEFDSARLPPFWAGGPEIVERARGALTLVGSGSLHLRGETQARAEARVEIAGGVIETSLAAAPVENVRARLDLAYAPAPEHRLWTQDAWNGLAELSAGWSQNDVFAWARVGKSAGSDALRLWSALPTLGLAEEGRGGLEVGPRFTQLLGALDLGGSAEFTAGLSIASLEVEEGAVIRPTFLVDLRPAADATVAYLGFEDAEGERWGIPIPTRDVRGRIVWALDPALERPQRVGLVDLTAEHGSGRVRLEGTVVSPPTGSPPRTRATLDLELDVPSIALDETAARGLAGMPTTRDLWRRYAPGGAGTLSTRWFLHGSPRVGLTAQGDVGLRSERMTWEPLPVPVRDVEGHVALRWSDRATLVASDGPDEQHWRAFGVHVSATGALATGGAVRADVTYRTESLAAAAVTREALPTGGTHVHGVSVRELDVESEDFDVLALARPEVAEIALEVVPGGTVDLDYRGVSLGPGDPYRFDLEITPREVVLEPRRLGVPVADVAGRVVVSGRTQGRGSAEAPAAFDVGLHGSLAGRAILDTGGFPIAATAKLAEGEPLRLVLHGSGIDPGAKSVQRTLREAIGLQGAAGTQDAGVTGLLDAEIAIEVFPASFAPPSVTARADLRGNALEGGRFRIDDLRGSVDFRDSVLHGDRLTGRLAGSPVELEGLRLFSSDDLAQLPGTDPLLARRGFLPAARVPVLETGLVARDLDLDAELLSLFFEPETVDALSRKAELRGRLDLEDVHLVLAGDGEGGLKLGLHGGIVPNNAFLRVGLPMQASSGRVELDELVIEPDGTRARAHVEDLFARVAGRRLEHASMILSLVESRLSVDDLHGSLEGGSIASLGGAGGGPALAIDLKEPYFFTAALELADADANGLLRGMFETSVADKGVVDAWARLSGTPGDVLGLRGMGRVELEEARLWSIPVLRALFNQLGFDGTALFDRMEASVRLEDGVLYMTDVDARSPLLHLVGEGTLDLDGRLHHDLEVQYALVNRLGPLKVLLYWIQNSILRVAIRGTLWRPEIILRNALRDFFGGDPKDESSLPLPGFSPLPLRF